MLRSLSEVQAEFAAALRDPTAGIPAEVVGPDGAPAPQRFAVYRNNVLSALGNALASGFPAVQKLVGETFFRAMARMYVLDNPPTSPVLLDYGATLPEFIERFESADSVPYLADVARLELAWRASYHAAEATPISPEALAAIPQDLLPNVAFDLHPSARLVRSRYPVVTIWRMNVSDEPTRPVDFSVGEDALIVRPDAEVEVRVVPPGGVAFVTALMAGETLGVAAAAGAAADQAFDLAGNLAGLIEAGALVDVRRPGNRP
ncbi:DNA-binding domain-containing protein [Bauldia sp.]|uniref:HvfC/BufC N-terminal domain-containing protein n=1 Tax=Bauldia sp. TaxID=2575872 RepID=UPI003BAD4AFA